MGYYISVMAGQLCIDRGNLPRLFSLVNTLMDARNIEENGNGGSYADGVKKESWYSWIHTDRVREAAKNYDLIGVFAEWGYKITHTSTMNNIDFYSVELEQGDTKIGDEEIFFSAIAPAIADGSLIDIQGEDNARWRWYWEDGRFFSQDAEDVQITYGTAHEVKFHNVVPETENV